MKYTFYLVVVFFGFQFPLFAQEFQGKAEYVFKMIPKNDKSDLEAKSEDEKQIYDAVKSALKKLGEKKFELIFTKSESIFKEIVELENPGLDQNSDNLIITIPQNVDKYINLKDKISLEQSDIFDKEFTISESLTPFNWKLLEEIKKIGEYTCHKAEVIIPVSDAERTEYEEYLKREAKKSQLFKMEEPKPQTITAWYTPEIPVSFGPENYWGLPGLILELDEKNSITLCSKVTLSNKAKEKIKAPNKEKKLLKRNLMQSRKK